MEAFDEFCLDFRDKMKALNWGDRIKKLDLRLCDFVNTRNRNVGTSNFVSLGYMHEDLIHSDYHRDFIPIFHVQYWNHPVTRDHFIAGLTDFCEQKGALTVVVKELLQQAHLRGLQRDIFRIDITDLVPKVDGDCRPPYVPGITLVTLGASPQYPGNNKSNSIRAMSDVARLAGTALRYGLSVDKKLVPFWVYSSFGFKQGTSEIFTDRDRILNIRFLNNLL